MSRRDDIDLVASIVGAVLLGCALFAPWYSPQGLPGLTASAWEAFTALDLALAACAFLGGGLAIGILRGAADRTMTPALHVLGGLATALVVYRIAVQPQPAELLDLRWGAAAALAGAVLLAVGPAVPRRLSGGG